MCTLTIFPTDDGFRVAMNRDELRSRSAARAPEMRHVAGRMVAMPVDPVSGGTWVAVNDAGVVLALLNRHDVPWQPGEPLPPLSRGLIIPRLSGASTVAEALAIAAELDDAQFQPFRVVLCDVAEIAVVTSGSKSASVRESRPVSVPRLFTSSGLGDLVVDAPRRQLFGEMVAECGVTPATQDAFHRHSWPERADVSVCMRRDEAATVSFTTIDVTPRGAELRYFSAPPDQDPPPVTLKLPFCGLPEF